MDDRDLMGIRADTLFTYDARGRMLRTNEPEGRPAPRLFLGCTIGSYVVRFGAAVPDALARELTETIARQPRAGDLYARPGALAALRGALEGHGLMTPERGGPAYRFPALLA